MKFRSTLNLLNMKLYSSEKNLLSGRLILHSRKVGDDDDGGHEKNEQRKLT